MRVWRLAVRDLAWRRRRFAIAVAATALVFALTLLLSGLYASMGGEPGRTVDLVGADAWIVPAGASGAFTTTQLVPATAVDAVRALPGVTEAQPIVIGHAAVPIRGEVNDLNVVGFVPGSMGTPRVASGRSVERDGEIVADTSLGLHVGDHLALGAIDATVVGTARRVSFTFGIATIFTSLGDAQKVSFLGQPLASAIVTKGVPASPPDGLSVLTPAAVEADMHRPIEKGLDIIRVVSIILWIVAGGIVGSIVYLSALERTRDFAVLKATGTSNRDLLLSLAAQSLLLSGAAALVAVVLARLLSPTFPIALDIKASAYLGLAVLAVVVATAASAMGLRRAVTVDPALAFGGS